MGAVAAAAGAQRLLSAVCPPCFCRVSGTGWPQALLEYAATKLVDNSSGLPANAAPFGLRSRLCGGGHPGPLRRGQFAHVCGPSAASGRRVYSIYTCTPSSEDCSMYSLTVPIPPAGALHEASPRSQVADL